MLQQIQVNNKPAINNQLLQSSHIWFPKFEVTATPPKKGTNETLDFRFGGHFEEDSGSQTSNLPLSLWHVSHFRVLHSLGGGWTTHLKNMLVKLDSISLGRGENNKKIGNHHPVP